PDTMVFQMPYVGFLSYANSSHKMLPYSHFRGYLHSHRLRWSFGAMHGRFEDSLHARVAGLPLEHALRALAFLGFGGVFVDRYGYPDSAQQLEGNLRTFLGTAPIESRNGRLAFFDLADFVQRLRQGYTEEAWQQERNRICYGPQIEWGAGFHVEETNGSERWRWCGTDGTFTVRNPADHPQHVSLRFVARTCRAGAAVLRIDSTTFSESLEVDTPGAKFARTLQVPPGRLPIHFHCTALPYIEPQPGRTLVFSLAELQLEEIDPATESVHVAKDSRGQQ